MKFMEGAKFEANRGHNISEMPELESKEEQHVRDVVLELRDPIRKMLEPIMENIEGGDYQLLIGDDASGRVPALIVRKVINGIYAKNGIPPIPTRFIAGTRHYEAGEEESDAKRAKVARYLQELLAVTPGIKNALIVTDTISTGRSLLPLARSLKELGIFYDIVAVGATGNFRVVQPNVEEALGGPIFTGMDKTPSIYLEYGISGVHKNIKDLHSVPTRQYYKNNPFVQKKVSLAREEAGRVAGDILAGYVGQDAVQGDRTDLLPPGEDAEVWRLGEEEQFAD